MSAYSFHGRKRLWIQRNMAENTTRLNEQQQVSVQSIDNSLSGIKGKHTNTLPKKWSVQQLMRLLHFYRAHRCLWDPEDPDNRNRKLRRAALIDITAAMNDKHVKQTHVIQKINVLRATYRYEKRRIKQRIRQGIGAKTKLRWFAIADSFLRNVPKTEKFRRQEDEGTDSDLEDTLVTTMDPTTITTLQINGNQAILQQSSEDFQLTTCPEDSNNAEAIPTLLEDYQIKKEQEQEVEQQASPQWTPAHSLKFIQLLSQQRTLWNIKKRISYNEQQNLALQSIATDLALPFSFVEQRLFAVWRTLESEQIKIMENSSYRPPFVWWTLAEKLIAQKQQPMHFVAPAEFSLAENAPMLEQEMSADSDAEDNFSDSELLINPIPSVAPPSVVSTNLQEALDELFEKSNNNCHVGASQKSDTHADKNTKLIWNGLEDDLLEGKWSLKHSVKFLRLYGAHRCLWDLKDADYRSRELRNAAIKDIAAAMGYGLDAAYVAKKIKIFRITYMQHRKRMLADILAGKEPEIQLRWFPLADSFLRPHIGLRSIKEHQREIPQFDLQYVYANLNLIDPALLNDFNGKGTQNTISIGSDAFFADTNNAE